jgi:hypothetical protein
MIWQDARCNRGSRAAAVALCLAVVLSAAGCATTGGLTKDSSLEAKQAAVAARANARWQALIARDYKGAYAYLSPASREAVSLSGYRERIEAIEYRAVAIERVECEAEVCRVFLKLTYDFPPAKVRGAVTPLDENWIIDQGQAWFVFRG